MKEKIRLWIKGLKNNIDKLVGKTKKGYCGKCIVCKKISDDKLYPTNKLSKIYRVLYYEDICFNTLNKISRDKRYKDNIRLESVYPKTENKRAVAPTRTSSEQEGTK